MHRLGLEYGGGLQGGLKWMHSEILLMKKTCSCSSGHLLINSNIRRHEQSAYIGC